MTLAEAQASRAMWQAAYDASASGMEITWEGRTMKPQNPDTCFRQLTRLNSIINALSGGVKRPYSIADLSK